jgi:hypothetical protein
MKPISLTAGLTNMFGPLDDSIKKRLHEVLQNPREYWDRDHGIILRADAKYLTLWQAICVVDPTFPNRGPAYSKGKPKREWSRYPDTLLIARALRYSQKIQAATRKAR